jgi:hypothetical protein
VGINFREDQADTIRVMTGPMQAFLLARYGGHLKRYEGKGDPVALRLDRDYGIDYELIDQVGKPRYLATRIQQAPQKVRKYGSPEYWLPYNTWTIRSERTSGARTEAAKRQEALREGGICPHWTLQGYVPTFDSLIVLSIGIAETEAVYCAVDAGKCWEEINPADGNKFLCVKWSDVNCEIYRRDVGIWFPSKGAVKIPD